MPFERRVGWKLQSYDQRVPSARLRARLPCAYLRRSGWVTSIVPPDGSGAYDCVVFQKACSDFDLELVSRLKERGVKTIFDMCDNLLWNPDGSPDRKARADRIRLMLGRVDAVTVSTPALGATIAPVDSSVVDDAVHIPFLDPVTRRAQGARRAIRTRSRRPLRLVWFGNSGKKSPPAGMIHLGALMPDLEQINRTRPLHLTVISDSDEQFDEYVRPHGVPCRYVPWAARTFAYRLSGCDVTIIPAELNPVTRCKTSNRPVLSLMLGVPVVASPIPSYQEFGEWMRFDEWEEHLAAYAADPSLRREHVQGAQHYVLETYTPQRVIDQWSDVFSRVLG